ncbi:MAG: transglutaminase-like domain-containing protein [Chloroflexi bacterium]|nr:transglutaminase-like domain-containing protein [Chloroflexota bacterium]
MPDPFPREPRAARLPALRAPFAGIVARPDPFIDLAAACACIAAEADPASTPRVLADELDAIADRVRATLPQELRPCARRDSGIRTPYELNAIFDALHEVLYVEMGLRGAARDAWEPRHAYLGDVLRLGRGLPIALGVIELEVGWQLGLPLFGIGLPGHFILGGPDGRLIDPYDRGRTLSEDDCAHVMRQALGRPVAFRRSMLRPATRREIIARILGNLRGIYLSRREWAPALATLELLVILDPRDPALRRDRALLYGRCGRFTDAVRGLDRYLEEMPEAPDRDEVRIARGIFGGRRN